MLTQRETSSTNKPLFADYRAKPKRTTTPKMKPYSLITSLLVAAVLAGAADSPKRAVPAKNKAPNPAFAQVTDDPKLPRVLLIGDSISIGYTLDVRKLLEGKANLHRIPTNGGPTINGLKNLKTWLGDGKWDVIHFNWGLHDLKYLDANGKYVAPDQGKQVAPLPVYEKNLRELVARMKKTGAKLIWCSTTPVPDGSAGRVKDAEIEYNRVAATIMKENGVAIDDLHAYATAHQAEIQLPKNVHFSKDGSQKLAEQVVASIKAQLAK